MDETVTQTTVDTPNSEVQAPPQTVTVSPGRAHKLYAQGNYAAAFDMFYALATRGDDRSQYNIGVSYYNGVEGKINRDVVEAYAWMITSEMEVQEPSRTAGISALKETLTVEKQLVAQQRAAELFARYGSGKRVDSSLELISSIVHPKLPTKTCSRLGSRLKTSCHRTQTFVGKGELHLSPITQGTGG
jgi:hypothetical protein